MTKQILSANSNISQTYMESSSVRLDLEKVLANSISEICILKTLIDACG